MDPALIVVIVSGLFGAGGIAAMLKTRADNKKTSAEADVTLGGGWQLLYSTYREEARTEINELRERLAIVEANEKECHKRLARIEATGGTDIEKTVVGLIDREIVARGGGPNEPVPTREHRPTS